MPRTPVAALAFACALALAGTAAAAHPGGDGRIAFSRSAGTDFDYDIFTMLPTGADRSPLVTSSYADLEPAFSHDGRAVVFTRDVDKAPASANNELFVKDLLTGPVTRLTNRPSIDWNPAFSPDGRFVAFSSNRGAGPEFDIFVLDLMATPFTVTRIHRPGDDFGPVFTADGTAILWSGYRANGRADIFVKSPISAIENVTRTALKSEEFPDVSPVGTKMVYQRWGRGAGADPEIVLHELGTSGEPDTRTVLTRNGIQDLRPVFSPAGTRIAWERSWDQTDTSGQIWTMRIDGSHKKARTPRRFDADSPDWQPRP